MRWACQQRLQQVDFLCGDFHWKKQFHLTPRPLFLLSSLASEIARKADLEVMPRIVHA
jgi:CelD/BcsL family acetyltransferase involved in cellulose biosynthesis